MTEPLIILIGFMGSGKTTVATALGRLLSYPVVDLDEVVSASEGSTPAQIIEQQSEKIFREIESRYLREVVLTPTAKVVALGGGTWVSENNRDLIGSRKAITIWLDASFELCWRRILKGGGNRPLARNEQDARMLYEQRKPVYSLAAYRIEVTEGKSVDEIVREIINLMNHPQTPNPMTNSTQLT